MNVVTHDGGELEDWERRSWDVMTEDCLINEE